MASLSRLEVKHAWEFAISTGGVYLELGVYLALSPRYVDLKLVSASASAYRRSRGVEHVFDLTGCPPVKFQLRARARRPPLFVCCACCMYVCVLSFARTIVYLVGNSSFFVVALGRCHVNFKRHHTPNAGPNISWPRPLQLPRDLHGVPSRVLARRSRAEYQTARFLAPGRRSARRLRWIGCLVVCRTEPPRRPV